jgi:Secretion system C-terminal sorting domain
MKKLKSAFVVTFLIFNLFSSYGQQNISKVYADSASNNLSIRGLISTLDKGFILWNGNGKFIKLDSTGNVTWSKKYDFPIVSGYTVKLVSNTNDSGCLVVISNLVNASNNVDFMYFKFDRNGSLNWIRTGAKSPSSFFMNSPQQIISIRQQKDSSYLILSYQNPLFSKYYVVQKLDKYFNTIWYKTFIIDQSINSNLNSDEDGFIYLAGSHFQGSSGNVVNVSYIIKLNQNGNVIWSKRTNIGAFEEFTVSSKGPLISVSKNAIFGLIQLDTSGALKWQKFSNHQNFNNFITSDGGFISSIVKNSKYGIAKYDSVGNLQWSKNINSKIVGADLHPSFYYALATSNSLSIGSIELLNFQANSSSISCNGLDTINFILDSIQINNDPVYLSGNPPGVYSIYNTSSLSNLNIVSNMGCLASNIIKYEYGNTEPFKILPNPSNGIIEFTNQEYTGFNIEICNTLGKTVLKHESLLHNISLDLGNLGCGIYLYKTKSKSGNEFSGKLIIQN